jgi:hypothetical protein
VPKHGQWFKPLARRSAKIVTNPAGHRSMETKYSINSPDPPSDCLKIQKLQASQKWRDARKLKNPDRALSYR